MVGLEQGAGTFLSRFSRFQQGQECPGSLPVVSSSHFTLSSGCDDRDAPRMFVDHIRIFAKAGDGGNGVISFRREKFVPRGGPDGGDGGDGGDVVLVVDPSTDNLRQFFYDPKLIAQNGNHGGGSRKTGKRGKKVIARVPPGTVVYRSNAATVQEAVDFERSDEGIDLDPVADLTEYGQEFVVCKGGFGGRGNWNFRTSTN
jgi:GTP-binding protein